MPWAAGGLTLISSPYGAIERREKRFWTPKVMSRFALCRCDRAEFSLVRAMGNASHDGLARGCMVAPAARHNASSMGVDR